MKRLLAILISIAMLCSLAACATTGTGGSTGKEKDKNTSGSNESVDMDAVDSALDLLEQLVPEGWDENDYGAYIYNVWDEDFLPDIFPSPIDGIKVDQTNFKDYKHDTLNGSYQVGRLYYDNKEDYRKYSVSFYATEEQINTFAENAVNDGFKGNQYSGFDDDWWEFDFYHEDGWYMHFFVNTNAAEDGYDGFVTISMTDSVFENPASIAGIPLPQTGMPEYDYKKGYTIQDFTNGYEDMDFDLESASLPTEYYAAWFGYLCTTMQDAKDYAQKLVSEGWTLEYESEDDGTYYSMLVKDGVYAVSNYYDYECRHEVGFSDMVENLQY